MISDFLEKLFDFYLLNTCLKVEIDLNIVVSYRCHEFDYQVERKPLLSVPNLCAAQVSQR